MKDEVRLTVKELAEGLFRDAYYGNDETVNSLIAETLQNVVHNCWPTKYLGPRFRLVLTWIAWNHTLLATYMPDSDEKIPPKKWAEAFKGYKVTWPKLIKAGHRTSFEFLDAEIKKEELKEFLLRYHLPLPCPEGGIPANWFYVQGGKQSVVENTEMSTSGGDRPNIPGDREAGDKKNKSGRPPSPLRQVVEAEYPLLRLENQLIEIHADFFGEHLKKLIEQEGHENKEMAKRASYARQRIKSVKMSFRKLFSITTEDRHEERASGKKPIKSKTYNRKELQDIINKSAKSWIKKVS